MQMRLLISFMVVFTTLMCLQTVRPHCSMTTMVGIDWLACLIQSDSPLEHAGKRVQFDDETLEAIIAVARRNGRSFQELTDEAFADLLKKHKQPVGLIASLKESVSHSGRQKARKKSR
jgi:hypothetical protein